MVHKMRQKSFLGNDRYERGKPMLASLEQKMGHKGLKTTNHSHPTEVMLQIS